MRKLWIPSPFCHPRDPSYPLDMLVVHHIGSNGNKLYSVKGTVTWFTNEEVHRNKKTGKIENKVSAHYIIPRKEYEKHDIIHLVSLRDVAYHAGYSQWSVNGKNRKYLNKYSVGIELEGDGNLVEYTDFQYECLIELTKELMRLYGITEDNIVGHEDVSPGRKVDPGKLFDWKRYRTGINPPALIMPEVLVTPAPEPEEENNVVMGGGEDNVGSPGGFIPMLLNLLKKIFAL